jgi:hypothetical protein
MTEFNRVMGEFMTALTDVFPESNELQSSLEAFTDLVQVNYKKPKDMFIETICPHAKEIFERDGRVFDVLHFPGFDFKKYWNSDISTGTKNAIWSYMHELIRLCGCT